MTAIEDARAVEIRTDEDGREAWSISLVSAPYVTTLRMTRDEARLVYGELGQALGLTAPPTDDEREALARSYDQEHIARTVQAAKDLQSWFTEQADSILERIKTDTHDDVMLYHDAVSLLVTARQMINVVASIPKSSDPERAR
jgi:hypothetical protein